MQLPKIKIQTSWGNLFLILLFLVLGVIAFYDANQWIGHQFPGFLTYKNLVVSPYNLTAAQADLRYPYKVVAVQDSDIRSYEDLQNQTTDALLGEELRYTLEYSGPVVTASSMVSLFEIDEFFLLFAIPLIIALIFFSCGILCWFTRAKSDASDSLFLFCMLCAMVVILTFDMSSTHRFVRLYLCLFPLVPAALIQLSLHFPSRRKFLERFPTSQWYPYVLSLFLILILQAFFYDARDFWILVEQFTLALMVLAGGVFVLTAILFYRESLSTVDRLRAKVVLMGSLIAFGVPAAMGLLNILGILNISRNVTLIPVVFFPLSIAYAILRHDLFNMDIYIKRALISGLLTLFVALLAAMVWYVAVLWLGVEAPPERPYLLFWVLFITLLIIHRVYLWTRGMLQRSIFRRTVRYQEAIENLSQALIGILDQNKIADLLVRNVVESMELEGAKMFLWRKVHENYMLWGVESRASQEEPILVKMGPEHPMVALLKREKRGLMAFEIEHSSRFKEVRDIVLAELRFLRGEVFFPILFHERLVGVLVLGGKIRREPFTSEDIKLLRTLANNVAVALENAESYEQLKRMTEVLDQRVRERTKEIVDKNVELAQAQAKLEEYSHTLEKKVEEQTRMLIQAEKMASLGTLVAGIAHEVNNPLNIISLGLYRMKEVRESFEKTKDRLDPATLSEMDEVLGEIRQCYEAIHLVVRNLREFSYRGKEGGELVDIHRCLETTLQLIQSQFKDRVSLEKNYGEVKSILGSFAELNQVFMNILMNAFQAIPKRGTVRVQTWMSDGKVKVSIEDTGTGIAKENLRRIFDPFFTTKPVGKGLGLGLSIAYQVIERHKGKIEIESEENQGTKFILTFPSS
ncbi:MAG: GAF domain-containing protein [Deltaproteobacteria bacterium]|nr:GAF domain-containing protein [Deltaproteobacteria bacterium]